MSETYTKLFGSITESTIWQESDPVRLVWITMLAMADRHGYVGASIPGLATRAHVSIPDVEFALEKFLAPDKYSRSQEYDGRRIEVADRGWTLLNYERFRDMRDEEARKEYERNRKREARKAKKKNVPDSPTMSRSVSDIPHLSAQAEADTEAEKRDHLFDAFWDAYPKKQGRKDALKAWTKLNPDADLVQTMLDALDSQVRSKQWRDGFIPLPATYLRGERWLDQLQPTDFYQARL